MHLLSLPAMSANLIFPLHVSRQKGRFWGGGASIYIYIHVYIYICYMYQYIYDTNNMVLVTYISVLRDLKHPLPPPGTIWCRDQQNKWIQMAHMIQQHPTNSTKVSSQWCHPKTNNQSFNHQFTMLVRRRPTIDIILTHPFLSPRRFCISGSKQILKNDGFKEFKEQSASTRTVIPRLFLVPGKNQHILYAIDHD